MAGVASGRDEEGDTVLNQNEQTRRADADYSLLALDPKHHELWAKGPVRYQTDPEVSGL